MKGSWNTATVFFNILGMLSVLLLFDHATHFGWVSAVKVILSYYEFIKDFLLTPIKPFVRSIVEAISRIVNYNLNLMNHWSDVFVLITLYFGARMRSYWKAGMRRRALFRTVWGAFTGLLTGVVAGLFDPHGITGNLSILLSVLVGIAIFDIFDAAWSATFHRKLGMSWMQDWMRYSTFSMPPILIGGIFTAFVYLTYSVWSPNWVKVPGIIALLVYSILLAIYWLYQGLRSSLISEKSGTGYDKFISSSNSQIGILMLRSLLAAGIVAVFSAGWNLVQT